MTDRLDRLLGLFASRTTWTTSDLAAELEVSVRTVRRDIARLRARGVPIEAEAGRGGGLRVPPRIGLGRMVLSQEEIVELLFCLAIGEALRSPLLSSRTRAVRQKIAAAFPADERARVMALRRRILVGPAASEEAQATFNTPRRAVLDAIQPAFLERRGLVIGYRSPDRRTKRTIEPHYLLLSWPLWYIVAWDTSRAGPRTFRLDRVESARATAQSFRLRPVETMMTQAGRLFHPI